MLRLPTLVVAAAATVTVLHTASPAAAQSIGVSYVTAESDHVELPAPTGYSAWARFDVTPSWAVTLTYYSISENTRKTGTVCVTYSPRIGCAPAETVTEASLSGFRAAGLRSFRFTDVLRLELGLGASFNHVDADAEGLSGERADILVPNGGQLGALGFVSAGVTPVPAVPATISATALVHWVDFTGCSGEDMPQYDPFCASETFRQLEVSLGYAF